MATIFILVLIRSPGVTGGELLLLLALLLLSLLLLLSFGFGLLLLLLLLGGLLLLEGAGVAVGSESNFSLILFNCFITISSLHQTTPSKRRKRQKLINIIIIKNGLLIKKDITYFISGKKLIDMISCYSSFLLCLSGITVYSSH